VYRGDVQDRRTHRWLDAVIAVGAIVAVWSLVASLVPQPENWGQDLAVYVDAGWRLAAGQTPHEDFYSPLGPVPLELLALGLRFTRPSVVAVFTGVVLSWLAAGLVMWGVAARRVPWWVAAWLGVWTVLVAGSPRPLGFPLDFVTSAMFYNRLGEALIAIVAVGALLPTRRPGRPWLTAIWLTVPLGLLMATKLNYAGAAVVLTLVGGWVRQRPLREAAATVVGGVLACLGILLLLGVPPTAFLSDMGRLMAAQDPGGRIARQADILRLNWAAVAASLVAVAVAIRGLPGRPSEWMRLGAVTAAGVLLAVGLCATNYQERDLPLLAVVVVIVAARAAFAGLRPRFRGAVVAVAAVLTVGLAVKELAAVRFALGLHAQPPRAVRSVRVAAAPMADVLYIVPHWVAAINDGIASIRTVGPERPRVLVTDLANPFSFAMGLEPPRGDALWWHLGTTFSATVHPAPESVFATVNVILEPEREIDAPTVRAMWAIYGEYIRERFEPVADTAYWRVWVRQE
jgi:hypothetical protein